MSNRRPSLWKVVIALVIIVVVGFGLLLSLTHWNAVDLINSPARLVLPEHSGNYEKVIFKVLAKEMDGFPQIITPEIMKKEGVVSILHGTIYGETIDLFDEFVANSSDGKATQIMFVIYTTEGDPIYMNVLFDRVRYLAVIDRTHDRFISEDEAYENLRYDHLKIITNPETESKFVILTNDAGLTYEQLRIAQISSDMEGIDSFQLFSYSE
ncbi:MAG: DUF4362 domain-containing protein [Anaerolineaceae bacterium]